MDCRLLAPESGSKGADLWLRLVRFFDRPYPECSRVSCLADVCCHSCLHCAASGLAAAAEGGWCRLRRLPVHAELARVAWCHHWTARPP